MNEFLSRVSFSDTMSDNLKKWKYWFILHEQFILSAKSWLPNLPCHDNKAFIPLQNAHFLKLMVLLADHVQDVVQDQDHLTVDSAERTQKEPLKFDITRKFMEDCDEI